MTYKFIVDRVKKHGTGKNPHLFYKSFQDQIPHEEREYNVGEILLGNTRQDMRGDDVTISFKESIRAAVIGLPGSGKTVCLNNIGFQAAAGGIKTVFINDMKGNLYPNLCKPIQPEFSRFLPRETSPDTFYGIARKFKQVFLKCIMQNEGVAIDLMDAHTDDIKQLFNVSNERADALAKFLAFPEFRVNPTGFLKHLTPKLINAYGLGIVPKAMRWRFQTTAQNLLAKGVIGRSLTNFRETLFDNDLIVVNTQSSGVEIDFLDMVLAYLMRIVLEYPNPILSTEKKPPEPALIIFDEAHRVMGMSRTSETNTYAVGKYGAQTKRSESKSLFFAGQTVKGETALDPKIIGMCNLLLLGGAMPQEDLKIIAKAKSIPLPDLYRAYGMGGRQWLLYDTNPDNPRNVRFFPYVSPCRIATEKTLG